MKLKSITEPIGRISGRIMLVRGQRVMIDADLAELYGAWEIGDRPLLLFQ